MAGVDNLEVTVIGCGMIVNDQILPSLYHLQRLGVVNKINICGRSNRSLKKLAASQVFKTSFPGQSFTAYPALSEPEDKVFPEMYKEVLKGMKPRQIVVVAIPDQVHYEVVKEVLANNQHLLCVKPLVLKYEQDKEIEEISREKGLFVGVEYHKRFDRRALLAKKEYELGHLGELKIGDGRMIEPYYYRDSNFQNWFTCENTDPFVYVGCHYVDQTYFITGLKPAAVSVSGVKGKFPNGNEAYMWANGRVIFENGAILSVNTGLGYPNDGAGSNDQGLMLLFEGEKKSALLMHNDQNRGVAFSFLEGIGPGGSHYNYVNPDYFKLIPWQGEGYKPVGYGFDSVAAITETIVNIETQVDGLEANASLQKRRELMVAVDSKGIIATPANSWINELVVEAARLSILNDGVMVDIVYGDAPQVCLRRS